MEFEEEKLILFSKINKPLKNSSCRCLVGTHISIVKHERVYRRPWKFSLVVLNRYCFLSRTFFAVHRSWSFVWKFPEGSCKRSWTFKIEISTVSKMYTIMKSNSYSQNLWPKELIETESTIVFLIFKFFGKSQLFEQ